MRLPIEKKIHRKLIDIEKRSIGNTGGIKIPTKFM